MDKFLEQLAERLQVYDAEIITADEIANWPDGKLDELIKIGVLVEIQHSKGLICNECEENCYIEPDIRINPNTSEAIGIFVCTRNSDIGMFEVDLNRLKRWKINRIKLSRLGYNTKKGKPEGQISRKLIRQNEKLQLQAALLKHHGFDSEEINHTPATQKELQKLTCWNQPKVHRVMETIFGNNPMRSYKARCRQRTILGFLKKADKGQYTPEAIDNHNKQ